MIKEWIYYSSILAIVAFVSLSFNSVNSQDSKVGKISSENEGSYLFPSVRSEDYIDNKIPYVGKYFIGFKEAIAFKESQGKYKKINSLGYMGKYQFGKETLKTVGIHDSLHFLNNPKLQEKAFVALLSKNKWELRDYISRYEGKIIDGVKITESGILAAAHLGGAGSVKLFLKTKGLRKCRDNYGTSVKNYLKDFAGYETSAIIPMKNATVAMN